MKYSELLDDYYLSYVNEFILYKIILALPNEHPDAQPYFTCKIENGENRLSPVFIRDDTNTEQSSKFVFCTEEQHMYVYDNQHNRSQSPIIEDIWQYINDNPYVVFFHGCDDGHTGLRFKTKELMIEFIESLSYYEDVVKFDTAPQTKDLKYIKQETGESISLLLEQTLQYHN